jgi:hypothetical protein
MPVAEPLIVTVYAPAGTAAATATVIVAVVALPESSFGVIVAVTPTGSPLRERTTLPLNPATRVSVIVEVR